MSRDLIRAFIILVVAWAILFAPQLFARQIFVIGDAGFIRAFAEFSAARWSQHHERTHWNPYIYAGLPATASLQDSRPQWLPDPLLTAFDALHRLPAFPPLAIPLLTHLAGMLAMAALARRLWGAGMVAMTWAGLAWGLLPSLLVPLAFGQDALVMAADLAPPVLLALDQMCAARGLLARVVAGLGLSLALTFMVLASHPQMIVMMAPLILIFAIDRARTQRRAWNLLDVCAAGTASAAMSAAIWWPALLYNQHSVRGGGIAWAEVTRWSAGISDLVSMAWPRAAGFGGATYWGGLEATDYPHYAGFACVVLALWGLRRRDGRGSTAALLAAAAAVAMVLSLGAHLGPVYQAVFAHFPLWSSFRVAIRVLVVAQVAVALLSARGVEHLLERARSTPGFVRASAVTIAVITLAAAAWSRWGGTYADAMREARPMWSPAVIAESLTRASTDLAWRGLLLAALGAVILLAGRRGRTRAWVWLGASLIVALDLGSVSVPFLRRATGPPARIERPPAPRIARLAGDHGRVLDVSRERLYSNDWIRWRARSLTGNHPAVPDAWNGLAETGLLRSPVMWSALSIAYLGGVPRPPGDSTLYERAGLDDGVPVWRLRSALPRARPVAVMTGLEEDAQVLQAMASPSWNPRNEGFTTDRSAAGEYPGSEAMRIHWRADEPDHLDLDVEADSTAFLVIADTWFPGWSAKLDDRPWPIHRVTRVLRGLVIPPGVHRVRLDYSPQGWEPAVVCTRLGWATWLVVAIGCGLWMIRRGGRAARLGPAGPGTL